MRTKSYLISILITVSLLFNSCGINHKIKRENKKYAKLTSGMRYNTYEKASLKGIPIIVDKYNSSQDKYQVTENEMRAYMGFLMILAGQNRFAAAESDLILSSNHNEICDFAANNIQATIKYKKEWSHIADIQVQSKEDYFKNKYQHSPDNFGYFASELILANMNIRNLEFTSAINNFSNLAVVTGVDWPQQICSILAHIQDNEMDQAKNEYNLILKDKETPDKVKKWFTPLYTTYYNHPEQLSNTKDLTSNLFKTYLKGKITTKSIKSIVRNTSDLLFDLYGGIK